MNGVIKTGLNQLKVYVISKALGEKSYFNLTNESIYF